jgi:hypothetical protein
VKTRGRVTGLVMILKVPFRSLNGEEGEECLMCELEEQEEAEDG